MSFGVFETFLKQTETLMEKPFLFCLYFPTLFIFPLLMFRQMCFFFILYFYSSIHQINPLLDLFVEQIDPPFNIIHQFIPLFNLSMKSIFNACLLIINNFIHLINPVFKTCTLIMYKLLKSYSSIS